jgi:glycosyltransferase involved in cell wall biosynthesis
MIAPVVLFVYNRAATARKTLEALARNSLASQTDLHIFSDGAKHKNDQDSVNRVRTTIRDIQGFASITIHERTENLGLAKSIISGTDEIFLTHQSVIVLEDDLITTPHFLEYMNAALQHYKNDSGAFSVTGHTFPEKHLAIPKDYSFDTYAGYRCSSWSWGTWRDRWQQVRWDMDYYPAFAKNIAEQESFNRGGSDLSTMLKMQYEKKIDSWAIRFSYAHHTTGTHCIYPTKTLVKNIGLDHSGTHSIPNPRYEHAVLDDAWTPKKFCSARAVDNHIAVNFRAVFDSAAEISSFQNRILSYLPLRLRKTLGRIKRLVYPSAHSVNVLMVNALHDTGGAARAAWRIFSGLRRSGVNVHYLTLFSDHHEDDIIAPTAGSIRAALARKFLAMEEIPFHNYPCKKATFFSHGIFSNPLRMKLKRFAPKLLHLHWIGYGIARVEELVTVQCPIVWTLHDEWALTGGCHYTGGCEKFLHDCGACPQLGSTNENDLSFNLMRRKKNAFKDMNITIVAPSRWLATQAQRSTLFSGKRIEVIPYGLDIEKFKPIHSHAARQYLGLNTALPVILFGAETLSDPRKGGDLLIQSLAYLDFPHTLLIFGNTHISVEFGTHTRVHHLGKLKDDAALVLAYSAADVFVCPSREDNLPNTVLESLACGTPSIGFSIGGLPDMIDHKKTGWLSPPFDVDDMAHGLTWILTEADAETLRTACREKAVAEYSLPIMAARYRKLYDEILQS